MIGGRQYWTPEEHQIFVDCYQRFGRRWSKTSKILGNKTPEQVRSHAQKWLIRMEKMKKGQKMLKQATYSEVYWNHQCSCQRSYQGTQMNPDVGMGRPYVHEVCPYPDYYPYRYYPWYFRYYWSCSHDVSIRMTVVVSNNVVNDPNTYLVNQETPYMGKLVIQRLS